MKITKKQLKQIIKEEIEAFQVSEKLTAKDFSLNWIIAFSILINELSVEQSLTKIISLIMLKSHLFSWSKKLFTSFDSLKTGIIRDIFEFTNNL